VGHAAAKVVTFEGGHHLRLVLEPAESRGMQDAVSVSLEDGPQGIVWFGQAARTGALAGGGPRAEPVQFSVFVVFSSQPDHVQSWVGALSGLWGPRSVEIVRIHP
jgi:hypothetical protein